MSFWMGSGYKGTGVSPVQLAELLTCAGGLVLHSLPGPATGSQQPVISFAFVHNVARTQAHQVWQQHCVVGGCIMLYNG